MSTHISHRAKLLAMEMTIAAMRHTRSSSFLSSLFRRVYLLIIDGQIILWIAALLACSIAGFLIGYLSYFIIPK
jgi:hypothetical protein